MGRAFWLGLLLFQCLAAVNLNSPEVDYLIVSNRPEKITSPGQLFRYACSAGETLRVLVYHQNGLPEPLTIKIISSAQNNCPALRLLNCFQAVHADGMAAGHAVTKEFWQASAKTDLRADTPEFSNKIQLKIPPGKVGAMILQYKVLADTDIIASAETELSGQYGTINREPVQGRISGFFTAPQVEISKKIDLTKTSNFKLRIGDEPNLIDYLTKRKLKGNYGLVYRYKLQLQNKSVEPGTVVFYFIPQGGPARMVLAIDRQVVDTEVVAPGTAQTTQKMMTLSLAPGEIKEVQIETMPEPGSNYPVTLLGSVEYPAGRKGDKTQCP